MIVFTESVVEDAALAWLEGLGYAIKHGPDIAPDIPAGERRVYLMAPLCGSRLSGTDFCRSGQLPPQLTEPSLQGVGFQCDPLPPCKSLARAAGNPLA